jgi:plasmid stability protein
MVVLNLRDFPEDIHREAKIRAAVDGVSMKEIIIRALTEYLKRKPSDKPKKGGKK